MLDASEIVDFAELRHAIDLLLARGVRLEDTLELTLVPADGAEPELAGIEIVREDG